MSLGSLIILNLFIGVIMSGMEEAQKENELARREYNRENNETTMADNLGSVLSKLAVLQKELESLQLHAAQQKEKEEEAQARQSSL